MVAPGTLSGLGGALSGPDMRYAGCVKAWRLTTLGGALCLAMIACNIQPQAFANGSTQKLGSVSIAMDMLPNPPRVGQPTNLVFTLHDGTRAIGPGQGTCEVVLDMPKMPMSMSPLMLDSDADGRCQVSYTFAMAGGWSATLRQSGQQAGPGQATFQFDVGP